MAVIVMDGFDYMINPSTVNAAGKWDSVDCSCFTGTPRSPMRATKSSGGFGPMLSKVIPAAQQDSTFMLGAWLIPRGSATLSSAEVVVLRSPAAGAPIHGRLRCVSATGGNKLTWTGPDGSTVLGQSFDGAWPDGEAKFLELKVVIHDTAGSVLVKVNGTTLINVTGVDTRNGTSALVGTAELWAAQGVTWWDDIYILNSLGGVNNDLLGDRSVKTLMPNGNGASSGWVGSDGNSTDNYALVDEKPAGVYNVGGDYVEASASGTKDTYAFEDLSGGGQVHAVQVTAGGWKTDSVALVPVDLVARTGGGTEATGNNSLATQENIFKLASSQFDTQPGGSAWDQTAVNAAEFGIKIA